jgi:hypothetical protein
MHLFTTTFEFPVLVSFIEYRKKANSPGCPHHRVECSASLVEGRPILS